MCFLRTKLVQFWLTKCTALMSYRKKSTSAVTDVMSYVCIWRFDVFYKEYTRF